MDQQHKTWAIRAGIGASACALLTAWMVPNTTPVARPSVIAGMSGTAEAQKPTYSAVPDSAIPSWAATLQPVPASPPPPARRQVADAERMSDMAADTPPDVGGSAGDDSRPPPMAEAQPASPVPPAPRDDYQARRTEWQARLGAAMQGQPGAGGEG